SSRTGEISKHSRLSGVSESDRLSLSLLFYDTTRSFQMFTEFSSFSPGKLPIQRSLAIFFLGNRCQNTTQRDRWKTRSRLSKRRCRPNLDCRWPSSWYWQAWWVWEYSRPRDIPL